MAFTRLLLGINTEDAEEVLSPPEILCKSLPAWFQSFLLWLLMFPSICLNMYHMYPTRVQREIKGILRRVHLSPCPTPHFLAPSSPQRQLSHPVFCIPFQRNCTHTRSRCNYILFAPAFLHKWQQTTHMVLNVCLVKKYILWILSWDIALHTYTSLKLSEAA